MGFTNVPWNLWKRARTRLARSSSKGHKGETLPGEKRSGSLLRGVWVERNKLVFFFPFNLPRFMRRGDQPEGAGRERRWAAGERGILLSRPGQAGSWGEGPDVYLF